MRKALSVLVSAVIIIAVSIVAIAIVLAIGLPALDRAKEAMLISEAKDIMQAIDNAVREVIFEGQGSQRLIQIVSSGGDYFVEAAKDQIVFKLLSISNVISPGTYRKEGNIIISAGTDVKAYEKDYLNDSSLVGYWKLNTANSTNHTLDSTSYKNDGKLYNFPCAPTTCNFTSGKAGNALSFDGVNDYVDAGNAASLNITNAITMQAFVKLNNLQWNGYVAKTSTYWIGRDQDANKFWMRLNTPAGWKDVYSTTIPVTGIWYDLVGTYDGTTLKLYVNGNLESTTVYSGTITANSGNNVFIGGVDTTPTYPTNGTIDEVMIFSKALSADEIRQLYYRGLKGRETGTNLVLENERIKFEVSKIGNSTNYTAVNTSSLIDIITVKETGLNITPLDSAVTIEGDASSRSGSGYTELMQTGELLREATAKALVNSTAARVSYEIWYTLRSNADFVLQEIKNIVYW